MKCTYCNKKIKEIELMLGTFILSFPKPFHGGCFSKARKNMNLLEKPILKIKRKDWPRLKIMYIGFIIYGIIAFLLGLGVMLLSLYPQNVRIVVLCIVFLTGTIFLYFGISFLYNIKKYFK